MTTFLVTLKILKKSRISTEWVNGLPRQWETEVVNVPYSYKKIIWVIDSAECHMYHCIFQAFIEFGTLRNHDDNYSN